MATVTDAEVLLLWRALTRFRTGRLPQCAPKGRPATSPCPFAAQCPRWQLPDDDYVRSLDESVEETEFRRADWPCSRLLELLGPTVSRIT
jgi:hypothetical protein